ncbi:signal peptidase II [Paenibacillus cymbidii]|uniref:signal peptidase II n=1 Tax=Paenibacillus cymbidii TaxID=1639034 RepID=UPI0010814537|nr:signal peptidase II [Paenibacillus cymbidii]
MFYGIGLFVVLLDQLSKAWVRSRLAVGESLTLGDHLQLTHYQNTGAMGSTFEGYGTYFIVPAFLIVGWFVYMQRKGQLDSFAMKAGAAFFAGGALGNAVDRLLFAKVTDFIDMGRGISNLADHAINIGVLLIVAAQLVIDPLRRKSLARRCP